MLAAFFVFSVSSRASAATCFFNNPNVNTTDVAYGSINGAAPGRNLQFGLKLTF